MIVETCISYAHRSLLDTFFEANDLDVKVERRRAHPVDKINIIYEDNSETAMSLTFMGIVHLGVENMLCDYLQRCGIRPDLIGTFVLNRQVSNEEFEKQWQEHKKKIGLR